MDGPSSPLILTKLRVPGARPRSVLRARLLAPLMSEAGRVPAEAALTLVCAPAGYGKTTLLAEWAHSLQRGGTAVAWYGLDPGDNAPHAFGAYLVAALASALGLASDLAPVAQQLRASPEIDLHACVPAIINAVAENGHGCVLVLDDYHLIDAPAIHSALAALVEHLPDNLHIAIGSRSDPPLGLARLRARGKLREVRAGELRFTADEAERFLNHVMGLELSPASAAALAARTEGWIAGLQLAALSMAGRPDPDAFVGSFGGSHRYLVEYLMEEVVSRQPEDIQDFLLSTSILDRLCGPLCDALTSPEASGGSQSPGSQTILQRLETANLFLVPLDDQGQWYRYHHLFRDFLSGRLERTAPERAIALHRAAAEWHSQRGLFHEAVQHAFKTGDWHYAAGMVEQHCFAMLMRTELSTIHEWCAAFPENIMRAHPLLCINQAWTLVLGARRQNRAFAETRLHQAEEAAAALAAANPETGRALRDHAATVRSYLAIIPDPASDSRRELDLALRELAAYREDDTARFSALLKTAYGYLACQDAGKAEEALGAARQLALQGGLFYGVIETTYQLARLAQSQGLPERAIQQCAEGWAAITQMLAPGGAPHGSADLEATLPALGCLDVALGCVHLEQGRIADAQAALLHGLQLVGYGTNPYPMAAACLALFHLRAAEGRHAEALSYLARLAETWPDAAFCTRGLQVARALACAPDDPGAVAATRAWAEEFAAQAAPRGEMPAFGLGPLGGAELFYTASLAWARCQIVTGNGPAACSYLARQIALARTNGLVGRATELSHLLAEAERGGPAREGTRAGDRVPAADELSERELEVLRLMAHGASNQEISGRLVITVGTVKSHINHILGKLGAHNRTEAVALARARRLING